MTRHMPSACVRKPACTGCALGAGIRTISFMRSLAQTGTWLYACLPALALVMVLPARALVIRLPDGSYAPGCGLVAHTGEGAAAPMALRAARVAQRIPTAYNTLSASGKFRIYYDLTRTASNDGPVARTDLDGNGTPDWVDLVAHVADSLLVVCNRLGYTNPLNGYSPYGIYITELSDSRVYGYTYPDGYMEIDNDYAESIYGTGGATGLRVTLAHELFHAAQFTFWSGSEAAWWQEASATFMEDVLYPDINDYWQYLNPNWFQDTMFENPSVALDHNTGGDAHMYGAAVFCHFLDQSDPEHGQAAILYSFKQQQTARSGDVSVIIRAVESKMGQPIQDLLATFWVWAYFTGGRARTGMFFRDARGYAYAPPNGSDIKADRWVVPDLFRKSEVTGTNTVEHLGGWITRFPPDGSEGGFRLRLTANGGGADKWAWRIAVADPDTVIIYEPEDGRISVGGWERATDVILVGANGSLAGMGYNFSYTATYDPTLDRPAPDKLIVTLGQNRPNPFNPMTAIPFALSTPARVTMTIYDVTGRPIRTITDDVYLGAGDHTATWDGVDAEGRPAAAGLYIVHLDAEGITQSRRMVLLR